MQSSSSMVFFLMVLLVGLHNYQGNCTSSTETDDDSSRENGAEDPEPYTALRANEILVRNRRSNQPEKPSLTSIRNPSKISHIIQNQKLDKKIRATETSTSTGQKRDQELEEQIQALRTVIQEKTRSYAFVGQRTSDFKDQGGIVNYEITHLNATGAFNADTGFFTAPVKGIYYFSFNALKMNVLYSRSPRLRVQLIKFIGGESNMEPGQFLAGAIVDTMDVDNVHLNPIYVPLSMHTSAFLEKGNRVAVRLVMGLLHEPESTHGSCMTTFTGFLVEAQI